MPQIEWYLLIFESNMIMPNQYFFEKQNQLDKTMVFILA